MHQALGSLQAGAELGWRAGRRPPAGAPEPCKGRGRSTGVPHPSPAPAPEKPPAAAQRAQPGAGPWRCGGGRGGLLRACACSGRRPCFLEELTAPAGQRGISRPPGPARPCSQPRPEGRTQNKDAHGAVSQRPTYCSRAPRFATSGEDRETGSSQRLGSRGSAWGPGPRPAGADHRRRLKVQQAAALHPPEGTLAPSPHVEQPAALQCWASSPRWPQGRPHPCSPGGPQGLGERTPFYTTREHRQPSCAHAHTPETHASK